MLKKKRRLGYFCRDNILEFEDLNNTLSMLVSNLASCVLCSWNQFHKQKSLPSLTVMGLLRLTFPSYKFRPAVIFLRTCFLIKNCLR